MDLEELKKYLRDPEPVYRSDDNEAMSQAADAIESLQAKVAELERALELEKIESKTMRHGYRLASDRCAELEKKGAAIYLEAYGDALSHAAFYVRDHCVDGEDHAEIINSLVRPKPPL